MHLPTSFVSCILASQVIGAVAWSAKIYSEVAQDRCLSIQDEKFANGSKIIVNSCNGDHQIWTSTLTPDGKDEYYHPVNQPSLCLDAGDKPEKGSQVVLWKCDQARPGQEWHSTQDPHDPTNHIIDHKTGLCLDVKDASPSAGASIQLWSCSAGVNKAQDWYRAN